jgi:hypothetical protein
MNEQTKHDIGNAAPAACGPRAGRDATPKRERNSTLVAPTPGVLIHRIGDDDMMPEAMEETPRARPRRNARAPEAAKAANAHARNLAQSSGAVASAPDRAAIASTRVATMGPAYSLPRAMRMAVQRAREVQPRLINLADASYAGAEE